MAMSSRATVVLPAPMGPLSMTTDMRDPPDILILFEGRYWE